VGESQREESGVAIFPVARPRPLRFGNAESSMPVQFKKHHAALKHGGYTATTILSGESEADFKKLRQSVFAELAQRARSRKMPLQTSWGWSGAGKISQYFVSWNVLNAVSNNLLMSNFLRQLFLQFHCLGLIPHRTKKQLSLR
jgi:hypothetical protein